MDLRRVPFQFKSSDPVVRRAELLRKFGVPSEDKMFVDRVASADSDPKNRNTAPSGGSSDSVSCSPRLQHRIPCFGNDGSVPLHMSHQQSAHSSHDGEEFKSSSDVKNSQKTPHVHVVPIKLLDSNELVIPKSSPKLSRAHMAFEKLHNTSEFSARNLPSGFHHSSKSSMDREDGAKPKICNIPVSVEGKNALTTDDTTDSSRTVVEQNNDGCVAMHNGGGVSKSSEKLYTKPTSNIHPSCDVSLKQISNVLSELKALKSPVDSFNGVAQDKQYRYLDEMLTRCMLKLDDVDTLGDEKIRACRKAAVKEVQSCINILESKVQMMEVTPCHNPNEQSNNLETMKSVSTEQVGKADFDEPSELFVKSVNCEAMHVMEVRGMHEPENSERETSGNEMSSKHTLENGEVELN